MVVAQEIFGVKPSLRAVCDRLAAAAMPRCARFVRPLRAQFRKRLFARRDHQGAQLPHHARLGRHAARRRGGADDLKSAGPIGVIAFAWAAPSLSLRRPSQWCFRRRCAFTAGRSSASPTSNQMPDANAFWRKRRSHPDGRRGEHPKKRPEADIHVYPAGHGFYCDERGSFHDPSAKLAWERTLAFLAAPHEKISRTSVALRTGVLLTRPRFPRNIFFSRTGYNFPLRLLTGRAFAGADPKHVAVNSSAACGLHPRPDFFEKTSTA